MVAAATQYYISRNVCKLPAAGTGLTEHIRLGKGPNNGDFVTKDLGRGPTDPVGVGVDTIIINTLGILQCGRVNRGRQTYP